MKSAAAILSVVAADQPSFEEWQAMSGQHWNGDETEARRAIYDGNVAFIEEQNADPAQDATFGVNQFSAMTEQEFIELSTGEVGEPEDMPMFAAELSAGVEVKDTDWSTRSDIVNPVKNQGSCGSCWAFGATGALEPTYALATGTLYDLSEQQLVDCDTYSSGCSGGLSRYSFSGYYTSHGACLTSQYAYRATDGSCQDSSCNTISAGTVTGFSQAPANANGLQQALLDRPLKVSVYADSLFQSYTGGVLSDKSCYSGTNHAVIAVGFTSGNNFKIRNSWGTGWGEGGHIRVSQTSSCANGPFSMWYRTPVWPKLSLSVDV